MRQRHWLSCWGLTVGLFVLSGCSGIPITLTATTSPLPPGVRGTVTAYGNYCEYFLLGLIPISGSLNTQEALEEAKEEIGVDVLTDVSVDFVLHYYILFSNHCVHVRGMGVPRDVLKRALAEQTCSCAAKVTPDSHGKSSPVSVPPT